MAQSPEITRARVLKRKPHKASATRLPPAPKRITLHVADDKSDANRARSEKYQNSPAFRKAVRDVYDTKAVRHVTRDHPVAGYELGGAARPDAYGRQRVTYGIKSKRSLAERQALAHPIKRAADRAVAQHPGKTLIADPASGAILKLYFNRKTRAAEIRKAQLQHDVTTADDRKRIAKFVQSEDYKTALSDAAFAGAKARGLDDGKAAEAASRAYDDGAKRALVAKKQLTAGLPPTALDKAIAPIRHKITSTAMWTGEQLSRPLYAITNSSNEGIKALQGKKHTGLFKAAGQGLTLKKRTLGSDVLKTAGAPGWVQGVGGFATDVALDPLTYLTLGTGVPAEAAAKGAYRAALRKAEAEGLDRVAAERAGLKAAQDTYAAHGLKSHGLTAGVRTPLVVRGAKRALTGKSARREVVARGRLTSATARAVGSTKATGKLLSEPLPAKVKTRVGELADRAAKDLVHDYRPRNIDPVTWNFIRDSTRDFRAARSRADRLGSARAVVYKKALKGVSDDRQRAIRSALEADDLSTLSGKDLHVARALRQDLEAQYSGLVDAGIFRPKSELKPTKAEQDRAQLQLDGLEDPAARPEAKGYFPRYVEQNVFHLREGANRGSTAARIGGSFLKGRKIRTALEHMTPEELARYDLRIPEAVGRHVQDTERAYATKALHERMAALGEKVSGQDLTEAMQIRKGKLKGLGDDALRTRLARLEHDKDARLLFHDGRGFRALQNARGELDPRALKLARKALRNDRPVILVSNDLRSQVETLASRGQTQQRSEVNVLGRGFDKAQGQLKTLQTVVNPGYHLTNLLGDSFNAHLGGVGLHDFYRGKQLKKVERKLDLAYRKMEHAPGDVPAGKVERYGEHDLSDQQLVAEAIEHGAIKTGFGGHELRSLVDGEDATKRSVLGGIRDLNERREDLTRLATYYSARKRGMEPGEAANWVNKHHFDYSDLTDAERTVLRRFIPFYTFMSRNTRAQVRGVLTRPGVYANTEAARQESTKAAGMDPDFAKTLRDFEQNGVPWGLSVGGKKLMVFPKLPLTDLNNLNPSPGAMWQNLVGRGSPILKVAIEQTFGVNTFTKSDYDARVPAPSVFKDKTLRNSFNKVVEEVTGRKAAITDFSDPVTGENVPGWSWRFDELMRQVPATSQAVNATVPSRAGRAEDWKYALAGYALGPRPQQYSPGVIKLNQLQEKAARLKAEHDDLVTRVAHHKGSTWHGKIGRLNKEITKTNRDIYKQAKALGSKNPPGLAPKKGRKRSYNLGDGLGGGLGGDLGGSALGG